MGENMNGYKGLFAMLKVPDYGLYFSAHAGCEKLSK